MTNNVVMIMCPPYPQYKEPPDDQPECELFDCPKCKQQMWLSQKKRGILLFSSLSNQNIILACYDCIEKIAQDEPGIFYNHELLNI